MERRKFLFGAGSTAIGASAIVGSGAFNFANVERDVGIGVVDDSNAFLALNASSPYADGSGSQLELSFDDGAGVGGDGINENSDYSFTGVFNIRNQGSQPVGVWIEDDDVNNAVNWYGTSNNNTPDFSTPIEESGNNYSIGVGERVYINVEILLQENSYSDLPETITVKADASGGN
ncbi:DUF1102 domain-containing protein [Natronococcus sp. JC468]|uniref:DUF1102 domain-containing protein n=1 Tax=Natronococcus sp. JC468 TaxID=1961921 RepID=UPI0014390AB6|nr:DUF1102 domain-containing protein [Natronococcus sp. JC468]NKE34492.1 DUF1102 domain-containing protein [Natronococcus sp. JC468]